MSVVVSKVPFRLEILVTGQEGLAIHSSPKHWIKEIQLIGNGRDK